MSAIQQLNCQKTNEDCKTKPISDCQKYLQNSFIEFFFKWWAIAVKRVEDIWIFPDHCAEWCWRLEKLKRTGTVSARGHLKSITATGYVAYKLATLRRRYCEIEYMSYKEDISEYLLRKTKRYINELPEIFGNCYSLTKAETVLHYKNQFGCEFYCQPSGLLTGKRGRHPHILIGDDLLRDPEKKLDLSQIEKLSKTFFEQVEPMPTEQLHVIGTPQDDQDLFGKLKAMSAYDLREYPAELNADDPNDKRVLWENNPKFSYQGLQDIKNNQIGEKAYNKEYLCRPVRGEEAFITAKKYNELTCKHLKNYNILKQKPKLKDFCYAGLDIGKKTHPSHLAVFGVRKGKLIQVHSKWFDNVDYIDQLEYCKLAILFFGIAQLEYDDTRAEFEGFNERGELPAEMIGVAFTAKSKFQMATDFDKIITQKKILFLNDDRQRRQILSVDNDLKAIETAEGHGDSFFSTCLAVKAYLQGQGSIIWSP